MTATREEPAKTETTKIKVAILLLQCIQEDVQNETPNRQIADPY